MGYVTGRDTHPHPMFLSMTHEDLLEERALSHQDRRPCICGEVGTDSQTHVQAEMGDGPIA